MDGSSWLVGLAMGACLGVGAFGIYVSQRKIAVPLETLAELAIPETLSEFEMEILYYMMRTYDVVPYLTLEDFQLGFEHAYGVLDKKMNLTRVSKNDLRTIGLNQLGSGEGDNDLLVVFETQIIYIRDIKKQKFGDVHFYWWSPS